MRLLRPYRPRLLLSAGLVAVSWAAGLFAAGQAGAALRPFVFGGGTQVRTSTETLNEMLDPVKTVARVRTWEAGGGLRFFLGRGADQRGDDGPPWEFRAYYGQGAGDLPGSYSQATHAGQHNSYSYSIRDTYKQSYSIIGVSFRGRVLPHVGAFLGPAIQSVTFKGTRTISGVLPDPRYFMHPAAGNDQQSTRYGVFNVGAQVNVGPRMPGLELVYSPARFNLSTNRKASPWSGTFPSFKGSLGLRLFYDF